jgi:rSAM/selenodomain-associated transferase 2
MASTPTLAIVVPVYIEPEVDRQLDRWLALGPDELIVVAADDATTAERLRLSLARADGVRLLRAARGRAAQMNAGARAARSDILLFLHADTILPRDASRLVRDAVVHGAAWGRFDVRLSGARAAFRAIEWLMNARSALTGIATGDQAMFVRRDVFTSIGGFAPIDLMEDIELSRRLKRIGRPHRVRVHAVTSSRRWERDGTVRTILRMWTLRALYALGVAPRRLARWYR